MTADELIAEERNLAKPNVHLRPNGETNAMAAIWSGEGLVPPPGDGYQHWLTIDCRFLPAGIGPSTGCISVYTENRERRGTVTYDPSMQLSLKGSGRYLYAHPSESLPPLEVLFQQASPAIVEWLATLNWKPEWGYNSNFPEAEVFQAYEQAQHCDLTFDGESVFAVLGGWLTLWPDGDWPELLDLSLIVLTLAESEPWVEVFQDGDGFRVFQRIS